MIKALNDMDRAEIGRKVAEGYTSGISEMDGHRIVWKLEADKYE